SEGAIEEHLQNLSDVGRLWRAWIAPVPVPLRMTEWRKGKKVTIPGPDLLGALLGILEGRFTPEIRVRVVGYQGFKKTREALQRGQVEGRGQKPGPAPERERLSHPLQGQHPASFDFDPAKSPLC